MGFLDNANDFLNRETAKVGRAARVSSLNARVTDLEKQRDVALGRLGKALYPVFRDNQSVRMPNEALFACIEDLDAQIKSAQSEIAAIERQNAITSANGRVCSKCGKTVKADDVFCTGCGARIEAQAAPVAAPIAERACQVCGYAAEAGQVFCMHCGNKL